MPKRPCTCRAEWRLVPGKTAQRLSTHYQLDCDYGTPLITIFKQSDGNEPIYLCGAHVTEVQRVAPVIAANDSATNEEKAVSSGASKDERSRELHKSDVRAIENSAKKVPSKNGEEIKREEMAAVRPNIAAAGKSAISSNVPVAPDLAATQAPARISRPGKESVVRARVRDLTFGDSAKALVEEAIWNLEPGDIELYRAALQNGTPAIDAAQSAGGQLAIIVRKIAEYTQALEALLSRADSTINVLEAINKPLEQVMLELIGKTEISDAEKDAALERLGAFQESVNLGIGPEITPAQALKIACAIGEQANWGTGSDGEEELKPAYAAVYTGIKMAIVTAVPDITVPFERLVNLYVAKAELADAHLADLSHDREVVDASTRV